MADLAGWADRARGLQTALSESVEGHGGFLRCHECHRRKGLASGDAGLYLRHGWPKCCGHTMTWWTQRQVDAGEAPTDV